MDATVAIPLAVLIVGTFGFMFQILSFRANREDVLVLRREKANQEYVSQLETRLGNAEQSLSTCRQSEGLLREELNALRASLVTSMQKVEALEQELRNPQMHRRGDGGDD